MRECRVYIEHNTLFTGVEIVKFPGVQFRVSPAVDLVLFDRGSRVTGPRSDYGTVR